MTKCSTCGMRADADPEFHEERYGHWPTVPCVGCRGKVPFGGGPVVCERCDLHGGDDRPSNLTGGYGDSPSAE